MPALVEIANYVFLKLGTSRTVSLDTDSEPNRAFKAAYPIIRDAELRAQPWNFATRRAVMGALSEKPAFDWGYACQLPADYLALIRVGEQWAFSWDGNQDWQIQGRRLLTNSAPPIRILYTWRNEDTTMYDPNFVIALGCSLALELNETLTQSPSKRAGIERDRAQAISTAYTLNAIQRPPAPTPESSWITGRA